MTVIAAFVVAAVLGWWWRRVVARAAARRAVEAAVPELLELLLVVLRAGIAPPNAFRTVAPFVPEATQPGVEAVLRGLDTGERFCDAIAALAVELGPSVQTLADAFAHADRYGEPLPPLLDRLAAEVRHHRRLEAEAAARRLPVRLSIPLVTCVLPAFVLVTVAPLLIGALHEIAPALDGVP